MIERFRTGTIWNGVKLAFDTLRTQKLRAFLTVLGVIIGTGAIIGVGSILTGLDGAVTGVLSSFGTNTMLVFKWQVGMRFSNLSTEERLRKPLTWEDARAIRERCPSVEHVTPLLFASFGPIKARYAGNDYYRTELNGAEPSYAYGGQGDLKFGRFFTESENQHRQKVAVIGEDLHRALFPNMDPIGKTFEVAGQQFTVLGVMKRPPMKMEGEDDGRVVVPYWTMRKMFPGSKEHLIIAVAKEGMLPKAMDEVRTIMRIQRKVPHDKPDNFGISTSEQMIEQFRNVTKVTALVSVILSSIGLLVGGIGVMNIMLVSVTERTKEIGVRKAIGARRFDIVLQFLTEATVLTVSGGFIGILLGYLFSYGARMVFPAIQPFVPMWAVGLGLVVSVGVGLFFGIWPASKAARLDPVVALRYE
jgi:putative ABC transport system permease protein